jgi:hypothetical protein
MTYIHTYIHTYMQVLHAASRPHRHYGSIMADVSAVAWRASAACVPRAPPCTALQRVGAAAVGRSGGVWRRRGGLLRAAFAHGVRRRCGGERLLLDVRQGRAGDGRRFRRPSHHRVWCAAASTLACTRHTVTMTQTRRADVMMAQRSLPPRRQIARGGAHRGRNPGSRTARALQTPGGTTSAACPCMQSFAGCDLARDIVRLAVGSSWGETDS